MNATLLLVAATLFGVDVGWQKREDGGYEYIIQIEPEMLESLKGLECDIEKALLSKRIQKRVYNDMSWKIKSAIIMATH